MLTRVFSLLPEERQNKLIKQHIESLSEKDKERLAKANSELFFDTFFKYIPHIKLRELIKKLDKDKLKYLKQVINEQK